MEIRQVDQEDFSPAPASGGQDETAAPSRNERMLAYVTPDPSSAMVIRRAKRMADYLQTDCFAVAVHRRADLQDLDARKREALERHLNFARHLHVEARLVEGEDAALSLVDFAQRNGITQIFLARPKERGMQTILRRSVAQRVVQLARDLQVTVVANRELDG